MGDEVGGAGQRAGQHRRHDRRAVPTSEPAGQLTGFDANVASGQAFCSVVSREGSCAGSSTKTDLMFACLGGLGER